MCIVSAFSLLRSSTLLAASVGVAVTSTLGASSESAGRHVSTAFSLEEVNVSSGEDMRYATGCVGESYLSGLDPAGIGLAHWGGGLVAATSLGVVVGRRHVG